MASGGLGGLTVYLRANTAGFETDLGRAARAAKKSGDDISSGLKDGLSNVAGALAAAFSIGKIIEFGKSTIELGDQLIKMSQKVGISVESISAMRSQAQLSGTSIDDLKTGLVKLSRAAADAAGGSVEQAKAFQAMGVAVKDVNGNLRPTQTILEEISKKFASYEDSGAKAALATRLFGKAGADLIPFLNELGDKGLKAVTEDAQKYGTVISTDAAKASEHFNDNVTQLKQSLEGFGTQIVSQLLPSLNQYTDGLVEGAKQGRGFADSAQIVTDAIKTIAVGVVIVKDAVQGLINIQAALFDSAKAVYTAIGEIIVAVAVNAKNQFKDAFTLNFDDAAKSSQDARDKISSSLKSASVEIKSAWSAASTGITEGVDDVKSAFDAAVHPADSFGLHVSQVGEAARNAKAPLLELAPATNKVADSMAAALEFLARLRGAIDPEAAAIQKYVANTIKAQEMAAKLRAEGKSSAEVLNFLTAAADANAKGFDRDAAAIARTKDIIGQASLAAKDELETYGLEGQALEEATLLRKAADTALQNYNSGLRDTATLSASETTQIKGIADGLYNTKTALDAAKKAVDEWRSIWVNAGSQVASALANVAVNGGSLFKSLKDIAKQTVQAIIQYFIQLRVITPILQSLGLVPGGGGFSMAGGGMGGAGGFTGLLQSFAGGGGSGGGSGSIIGDIQQGWSAYQQGSGVFGSLFSGGSATPAATPWTVNAYGGQFDFTAANGGTYGGSGFNAATAGTGVGYGPAYGGYGSALGQGIGIAGGIYAGYNRYQNSGGGAAGLAGGAAYGVGTYFAGAGLAAGGAAIAGGAGIGAGLAAGAAAIPVVGWIALAAMLIDHFSGGKLFGTKYQTKESYSELKITPDGANVLNTAWQTRQGALFSGRQSRVQNLPVDQEALDAANKFFDGIKKNFAQEAAQLGVTTAKMIDASFTTTTTYDKKGKVSGTKTISEILGQKYEEDATAFAQRLSAENMIAIVDAGKAAGEATKIAQQWRSSAETLAAGAQFLFAASVDVKNGQGLLALKDDSSLTAITDFVESLQQDGESLIQTYQRLQQASAQYMQFVEQFKPAATYADDFQASLANIQDTMLANIKQANALAQAAGLSGAKESDLANIHRYAAAQAAQAIMALEASGNALAVKLGYADSNNLSDISSEIQSLQQKAGQSSSAIQDFGSSITQVSDAAKHAMDLLLGDLSPLNDQDKLQTALRGLQQGTVTKEAVLEIGRRLYASTQPYVDLFRQVSQFPDAASRGGSRIGGGSSSSGGLTGAEQQRLQDLLQRQSALEAAQRYKDAQTLAHTIAEDSAATGKTYEQVAADLGIKDINKLIDDLKLQNGQTFQQYEDSIKAQQDSAGQRTTDIVDSINALPEAIGEVLLHVLTGVQTLPGDPTAATGATPIDSGTGNRNYRTGRDIAAGIIDGVRARTGRSSRNGVIA